MSSWSNSTSESAITAFLVSELCNFEGRKKIRMGLFSSGLIFKGSFVLVIRWVYFAGGLIFPWAYYRDFTVYIMKFQNKVSFNDSQMIY